MMPRPSTMPTACDQTPLEDDLHSLILSEKERGNTGDGSTPGVQSMSAQRYREKRRLKKNDGFTVDNRTPDATDDVVQPRSTNKTETAKKKDLSTSSSSSDSNTTATELLSQFQYRHVLPITPTVPFIEVPVIAHYELRNLPGAWAKEDDINQGLLATQNLEQGTRIISERPLFTLSAPGDQLPELMVVYNNLPKSEQDRIWNLRPAAPEASEQLSNIRFLTDRLAFDLQNIIFKSEATRTKKEQEILDEMKPKLENAMNVWRVAARWHANRCSMTDLPDEQRENLPQGTPITGLFTERAQIRHSCVPNCFASYDVNLGRMNVHVIRNIIAGEELTLSAFADSMYYKNAEDRKKELSAWGLTCNCEACDEKHPKFETHEASRQRAHARVVLIIDFLARLDSGGDSFSEDKLNGAQNTVMALIRDLKATGCESVETVRWRNILVNRILPVRAMIVPDSDKLLAWQIILMHAKECERMGRICYGEDREEYRVLRQTRETTQAWVDAAVAYSEEPAPDSISESLRSQDKSLKE